MLYNNTLSQLIIFVTKILLVWIWSPSTQIKVFQYLSKQNSVIISLVNTPNWLLKHLDLYNTCITTMNYDFCIDMHYRTLSLQKSSADNLFSFNRINYTNYPLSQNCMYPVWEKSSFVIVQMFPFLFVFDDRDSCLVFLHHWHNNDLFCFSRPENIEAIT